MLARTAPARPPAFLKLIAHDLRWQLVSALAYSDRRAQELVTQLGRPANLVSYHLKRLQQARLVRQRHSAADQRAIYYTLDLPQMQALFAQAGQSIHPALGEAPSPAQPETRAGVGPRLPPPARLLFLCTHNSARSQMAEAIARHLSQGQVEAFSAGTEPAELHPLAIQVMDERGIDIRGQHSKSVSQYLGQHFDFIITVCDLARESCPVFPGDPEQIHWSFADPAAVANRQVRRRAFERTATELTTRVNYLLLLINRQRRGGLKKRAE